MLILSTHPNGNIADFLVGAGLAKVIDVSSSPRLAGLCADIQWHAGLLAPLGGLDRLRAAEKAAKEKRLGVWEHQAPAKSAVGAATNGTSALTASTTKGSSFDAVVVRIWGSDQLSVVAKGDDTGKERRLQLASVRGPRYVQLSRVWLMEGEQRASRRTGRTRPRSEYCICRPEPC